MVDMSVKIGSVTLKNPIMPASGCFSTDLAQATRRRAYPRSRAA
jgi:dihydroorotate dehydrogenase (NAD+) catalytic subunit